MKKNYRSLLSAFLLVGLLVFQTAGWAGQAASAAQNGKIRVITSLPIVESFVVKIGGDKVAAESIIRGPKGGHEYEPSASDMKKLATCAVFVKVGMGADLWADKLAAGTLGPKALFLDAAQGIPPLKLRGLENPHYWWNPDHAKRMAQNILTGLTAVAPRQRAYFERNYQNLIRDITQTAAALKTKVAALKGKNGPAQFVSYSGTFPYLYQYFGFHNLMTVEFSCEQEVPPRDVVAAVQLMKTKHIKVLVGNAAEPHEPDGVIQETGARKVLLWETTDSSNDYLVTLRHNVELLVSALQ